ncbi:MAG: response regulator [Alphaproteobacteria bacterium]|nr:response regulator [Alphaproteobacteria bacterium]
MSDRVLLEQLKLFFRPSFLARYGPFAAILGLGIVHWDSAPIWVLPVAVVMHGAATALLEYQRVQFWREEPRWDGAKWMGVTLFQAAIAGLTWAASTVLWFAPGDAVRQTFLCLILLGLISASMVVRASVPKAFFVHMAITILPAVFLMLLEGSIASIVTGVLALIYMLFAANWTKQINRDISDLIQLRIQNHDLIESLKDSAAGAIAARAAAENAREAAESGARAKSEFLATISHEIRTPLNGILGMADILKEAALAPNQREAVEQIQESGTALCVILDDILDLSKMEAGRLRIEKREIAIRQVVQGVMRILQTRAWEKRLTFTATIDPRVPEIVMADAGRLRQVLLNLAGNAIKFTDSGHVTIKVEPLGEAHPPRHLLFSITDTGIGIPGDLQPLLFQPFTQLDSSYARRFSGAGLGLAICRRLVSMMGGDIGVESEVGSGSTFWFTLPDCAQAIHPARSPQMATSSEELLAIKKSARALRVLIAEDDPVGQRVLSTILSSAGHQVSIASHGMEAMSLAGTGGFDVIFMDIEMPRLSGAEVIQMIRALPSRSRHVAIIGISGHPQDHLSSLGIDQAVDGFVQKPVTPHAVLEALASAIEADDDQEEAEDDSPPVIDTAALSDLQERLGQDTVVAVFSSYLTTLNDIISRLDSAVEREDVASAGGAAQDLASASADLGLAALSMVSRTLAHYAREPRSAQDVTAAVGEIKVQADLARSALLRLYPNIAAAA